MLKQYGLVFDLRRCTGCRTCVVACKAENVLEGPSWMKVLNNSGGLDDRPTGTYPALTLFWQPLTCMHCQKPPCIAACPAGAINKRQDGIVLINQQICTGCGLCGPACPYAVIQFNPHTGLAEKCTLCSQRVDAGKIPFCVDQCIAGAIHFGDLMDSSSAASKVVSSRQSYTPNLGNGCTTSNRYLAP